MVSELHFGSVGDTFAVATVPLTYSGQPETMNHIWTVHQDKITQTFREFLEDTTRYFPELLAECPEDPKWIDISKDYNSQRVLIARVTRATIDTLQWIVTENLDGSGILSIIVEGWGGKPATEIQSGLSATLSCDESLENFRRGYII